MKGFPGISTFKSKGSKFVKNNGYIIINPITGHRLNWWDWKDWKERQLEYNNMDWNAYRARKQYNPDSMEVKEVSRHFKIASKYDRLALNTPGQGTGIIILKHATINFYKWILSNTLQNIVKINNLVHDEINIDYPKNMPEVAEILKKYMEEAASIYCKSLPIPAELSIGSYWIH